MIHLNRDGAWAGGFFTIWTGQTLSSFGTQVAQFALVWWLTEKTGSATILATSVLVAYLPEVFLAPIIGALNDRWNRRIVMIVSDTLVAIAMAGLAGLFWMGIIEIWHIYAVNFLASIGRAFQRLGDDNFHASDGARKTSGQDPGDESNPAWSTQYGRACPWSNSIGCV